MSPSFPGSSELPAFASAEAILPRLLVLASMALPHSALNRVPTLPTWGQRAWAMSPSLPGSNDPPALASAEASRPRSPVLVTAWPHSALNSAPTLPACGQWPWRCRRVSQGRASHPPSPAPKRYFPGYWCWRRWLCPTGR